MSCEIGAHVHPCSALVEGKCRNGFPVMAGCAPAHIVSPSGKDWWHALVPACCDEEFPHSAGEKP